MASSSAAREQRISAAVIGVAAMLGAATLLWFSATRTLTCGHDEVGGEVRCALSPAGGVVTGVRSVRVEQGISSADDGPGAVDTIVRWLVFDTAAGDRELGIFARPFVDDLPAIGAFLADAAAPPLVLTRSPPYHVRARVAAAVLALLGAMALRMALAGTMTRWLHPERE